MAEAFEQTMRIHLWADVHAPKSARQLVRQITWLPALAAEDAALVASELVNNAVAHAALLAEANSVELRFGRAVERLVIAAEPAGVLTEPNRLPASTPSVGDRDAADEALAAAIVDGVADDWGMVEGSGWATLRI